MCTGKGDGAQLELLRLEERILYRGREFSVLLAHVLLVEADRTHGVYDVLALHPPRTGHYHKQQKKEKKRKEKKRKESGRATCTLIACRA